MSLNDSIVCLDEEDNDLITVFDSAGSSSSNDHSKSKKTNYNPPKPTFNSNAELMTFVRMLQNIKDESPAKWHQAIELFDLYFTEQQARFILKAFGKDDLNASIRHSQSNDKKNYIYHHVVFCRVVDRHNLKKWYGAEGYYFCEEGSKPNDNYKTVTVYF